MYYALPDCCGVDSARVTAATENAQNILDAVDHRRTSISGVDEDEEGQNLVNLSKSVYTINIVFCP